MAESVWLTFQDFSEAVIELRNCGASADKEMHQNLFSQWIEFVATSFEADTLSETAALQVQKEDSKLRNILKGVFRVSHEDLGDFITRQEYAEKYTHIMDEVAAITGIPEDVDVLCFHPAHG